MENYPKPSIANFGRSLFGGYCPTYVPDFVLHGIPCDEVLRQGLMSELSHAVQVRDGWATVQRRTLCRERRSGLQWEMTPFHLIKKY